MKPIKNFVGKIVVFKNSYNYEGIGLVKGVYELSYDEEGCPMASVDYLVSERGVHSCIRVDPETPARLAKKEEYAGRQVSYDSTNTVL